jgi:hypothetical protein
MKKTAGQRRTITISVCHPVAATVDVVRHDEDDDWEIESVRRIDCDASARSLCENMKDEDFDEMIKRANAAQDLP